MKDTVLEKLLESCENAILGGKPILILRTDEIELVRRIVESDRLVVRLSMDTSRGIDRTEIIPTCRMAEKHSLQLFVGARSQFDFNIHYITKERLKNFSDTTEGNYGIPTMSLSAENLYFPSLYLIPYQAQMENSGSPMWANTEWNAFLDRYLQECLTGSALGSSVILLYGEKATVPEMYQNYCEIIDEPYPEAQEIRDHLWQSGFFDRERHGDTVRAIADAMLGFSLLQMERMVRSLSVRRDSYGGCILNDELRVKEAIQVQKEQLIKKTDLLELRRRKKKDNAEWGNTLSNAIGGMGVFKAWLDQQKDCIRDGDRLKREAGVYPPKGVLLCGIPGCGKSMAVDCVADVLKVPLLKMDIGSLMGKYVGESEHNMQKALKLVEAMSPCILFIDELDKGFDSAKRGNSDSGPFKRMFGTLLSWMQDCKKPCFIFATANDISGLPKEFFRSGRFDCLYSLYMPTADECVEIFQNQMRAAEEAQKIFSSECYEKGNLELLMMEFARQKRYVTGADIAKLIQIALRMLWRDGTLTKGTLTWTSWETTLLDALRSTSVYGDSKENVDSIVFCYLRLMRSNFISASDAPLFATEEYHVKRIPPREEERGRALPTFEIHIEESKRTLSPYDQSMRELLAPLMEEYGALLEKFALEEMLK